MVDDSGFWLAISELARHRGVDKSAISRRVTKYEKRGLLKCRLSGGKKLVNVAEFDRVAGETTDAVRELNGSAGGASAAPIAGLPGDPVLAKEQARRAAYDADLKKLDLEERLGRLVDLDAVRQVLARQVVNMRQVIERLPSRAEECAAAVAKGGAQGARAFLKELAQTHLGELAKAAELDMAAAGGDVDAERAEPEVARA